MPLFSAVFRLFRAERKFDYRLVTEHQANGDQCKVTDAVTEKYALLQGLG
jgi:hypothetical protein